MTHKHRAFGDPAIFAFGPKCVEFRFVLLEEVIRSPVPGYRRRYRNLLSIRVRCSQCLYAGAEYGDPRFLVRGGQFEAVEGGARSRNVVIEFPSYQAALECYRSPEYATAMALRLKAGVADILVIEGYDGAQPGDG